MRDDGRITVVNRCRDRAGTMTEATGVARRVKGAPPSVETLRSSPFALDDAHTHALIGTPDRKYLWVLARTPDLDPATYDQLVATAKEQGFDISRLVRTEHTVR